MRTGPRPLLIAVIAVGLSLSGAIAVTADAGFGLSVSGAIDTPEETVEFEGSEYTIDGIAAVEPGEPIDISVSSSERYNLYLYDESGSAEYNVYNSPDESQLTIGTDDDELDTGALAPGTYALSLEPDGEGRAAVFPVVIQGYDLTLDAASTGDAVELEATAEPTHASDQPDELTVVFWDGDDATDHSLAHADGTTYEGTIDADELGNGVYDTYVAVPGDEASGFPTALAVESGGTVTVSSDEDDGTGGGGDPGDGGGEDDGDQDDGDQDDGDNGDGGGDDEGDDEAADTDNEDDDTAGSDDGTDETDADDSDETGQNVIEPTDEDGSDASDQDGLGTPGAALVGIAAALALVSYAVTRRNR